MAEARSFPPIATPEAHCLILGSMPGQASLVAGQYYAHPRNAFWPIMGKLLDFAPTAPYGERVESLKQAGIAVWDVLESCFRPGSLDADIEPASIRVNDFAGFFAEHPKIKQIYFNGGMAEYSFRKHVQAHLDLTNITCQRLPSSSPAHASLSFSEKYEIWKKLAGKK